MEHLSRRGRNISLVNLMQSGVVRPITRWGNPILHRPARLVSDFNDSLRLLLADMFATNQAANGAGLAASQIGVDLAVFIFDCADGAGLRNLGIVCNPKLSPVAGSMLVNDYEGCLSLPGAQSLTVRPEFAICDGQNELGESIRITGSGTLGRCLQHETDHLRGRVFGDLLPSNTRKSLYRSHERVAHLYPDDWPVTPANEEN